MPTFKITALDPKTRATRVVLYDSDRSTLTDEDFVSLVPRIAAEPASDATRHGPSDPARKGAPRVLKVSLGLSCNYSCEYCSQRFVPRADETNPDDIEGFLATLDSWVSAPPERVEFWGGEPLVYIKTMRPLAEALRARFPSTTFSVITNGALLTPEINEWLDRLGFDVAISHDGPGQSVRGPDPLDDPARREAILDLYRRLAPARRVSFNAMLNRANQSRAAIQSFFVDLTGDPDVSIGEGGLVDAYDEGGVALSLRDEDHVAFRNRAFGEIRSGAARNVSAARDRIVSFVNSIRVGRSSSSVGQKCGMDRPENIAVDLRGNVLTCQNVSAVGVAPNGESHRIGHVSALDDVRLRSARHWSTRDECPKCPMLQICRGSCMFLEGPLWDRSCDNAYSDAVPVFAAGIEYLTGYMPVYIEGDFREDRKDIFGLVAPQPVAVKRVIPIKQTA